MSFQTVKYKLQRIVQLMKSVAHDYDGRQKYSKIDTMEIY